MGFEIIYPKITGRTDAEKIMEIKSYLFQLADQLSFRLGSISSASGVPESRNIEEGAESAQATFNAVKALIMNSSDIINAHYHKLDEMLREEYLSKEDYMTHIKDDKLTIREAEIENILRLGAYVLSAGDQLDFITDHGTQGEFTYQKFMSGFAVGQGSFTVNIICDEAMGNGFSSPITLTIPDGIFSSIHTACASVIASEGIRGITVQKTQGNTITALLWALAADTEETPVRIDLMVTGSYNRQGG